MFKSFSEMLSNSINVSGRTAVVYPRYNRVVEDMDMTSVANEHEFSFATNNGVVCFVHHHEVYACPFTVRILQILKDEGFKEDSFFVPFSNGELPLAHEQRWLELKELRLQANYRDFEEKAMHWSDDHHIGFLPEEVLSQCIKIPNDGLRIIEWGEAGKSYPVLDGLWLSDYSARRSIGHYCSNNGRVVFVYRDGHTYVSRGYWILKHLEAARFERGDIFVPLSNGEQIADPILAARWEAVRQ